MDYSKFYSKITLRRRENPIRRITEAYLTSNKSDVMSFAGGLPNTDTYPFEGINVSCKDKTNLYLKDKDLALALQYGPASGYLPLLKKYRELQCKWHNPKRTDWNVMFFAGSQDCCSKVFEMFLNEGDPIMVQSPTYTATINSLVSLNPDFIEINQDNDGIIPEQIINVCEKRLIDGKPLPKLIYVNPTGANPTGTVLTENRRKQVYELAQKYNFLIVEDEAYCFIHFMNKQPTSFFSLDTEGRVIRADSFSKIISGGMRLGCVSANNELLYKLSMHVENSILQANSLSQVIVYKLFDSWDEDRFNKHFKSLQDFYREKRNKMLTGIKKHLTGLAEWTEPKGGFFIWIKLIGINDTFHFVQNKCIPNGLFVVSGNAFYYDTKKPTQYLRLSYSYANDYEIDKGLSIMAKLIREENQMKILTR
ncbi:PREDICTED: kynurenine/alpha-aminoadipate aminotransferase, mitochondrial-like [Polistes dominula]|uniref:Kynurenine/alpha-aminoadipate aminotransferase, mitochondrial-like n=1 Tax=Polistes dominula TaxID=743375 RepID=A0ABM1IJ59_POLDO|nr:PREDICTED: kynurenine/alpha-aminoadipate aminotransferase, mitochondrial-like [Polistes dominula]